MDLVVGASNDAVKSLVNKLGSLLAQEYTLIRGARDDIQYITDELASMQAFLNRLKRAQGNHDEKRLDWMKQVSEVSYDIEDCVDDVDHRLSGEPRGSGILVYLHKKWYLVTTLYARHCIATEIGNLKTRAQHVSERRMRYGVKELENNDGGPAGAIAPGDIIAPPPQLIGTTEPVELEDAKKELEPWFTEEGLQRFLAIVGFCGLGKTTLAMELYREFGEKFECRAFVLASKKFHLPTVLSNKWAKPITPTLRSLIKQVHEQQSSASKNDLVGIENRSEEDLKKKLADQLKKKRYLILIDDIWSVFAWENIRDSFNKKNEKGGTIVVTTRFKSVSESCRRHQGHVYEHQPLHDGYSYGLFLEKISSVASDLCPARPINGGVIKKACRGLPLAIVVLAGLMASKMKSQSKTNLDDHLAQVGEDLSKFHCYDHLPPDLKTCLLYMSMFPKGCQISSKRLIRRWIAEGFISDKLGKTVQESAKDCLNELISSNLIRAVNDSSNGKVKSCQIHDMVLEYIVSKSSDENFITVVGGHWQTPFRSYKVRRLSVQKSDGKEKEKVERMKLSHFRSLTALGSLRALHSTLHKFQIMQVLDLEGCKDLSFKQLMKICKMHQLKYLSLRQTDVKEIPSKIGRLESLEVLDIRETSIIKLTESVDKLQKMEHLLAGNKNKRHALKLTEGITKMMALQTLSGVQICIGFSMELLRALQNLTNLKKFNIYKHLSSCSLKYLAIDDDFMGFLDTSLNASQVPPEHLHTLSLPGKLSQVPKWIVSLHNLEKLTLSLTSLTTDTLLVLAEAELPELFSLIFSLDSTKRDASVLKILHDNTLKSGGMIFVPSGGFTNLKLLCFAAPVLPPLSFLEGAMPGLQRIELRFRMVEGVYGLENLESLQQVHLTISSQAPEDARTKASQFKKLASKIHRKPAPSVVLDEYNESSEQK
ncbi:hypothetical protein GQ55_8G227600 [Panicum hallii var. hallii]|uniref:AAA+ ATPase domain-containing protein n=1 Tax=Panicum hallii var. hallii TaxID=1504633 RepID=A0A2T7CQ89_9POAL|nr:hypothetical protein GQ55_8G227600 [Panicum hallii var. hallii]